MGSAFHQLCPRYSGTLTSLPLRLLGYRKPLYYVPWPQEFALSKVSDKVVMVICSLASNSKRKQKAPIELENLQLQIV